MNVGVFVLGVADCYRGLDLERYLTTNGIKFQNIWGINASKTPDLVEARYTSQARAFSKFVHGRELVPGEWCCSQMHFDAYQELLKSSFEWALILEDDAIILKDLEFVISGLSQLAFPAVVSIHDWPRNTFKKIPNFNRFVNVSPMEILEVRELPYCTYGYLLNRKAALYTDIEKCRTLVSTPDWPYLWPKQIRLFSSKQNYISTKSGIEASIIGERPKTKLKVGRKIIFFLPNIYRIFCAVRKGVPIQTAFYREFFIKMFRLFNFMKNKFCTFYGWADKHEGAS